MDSFNTNVFINCPFDKPYQKLLHPLLFTLVRLGYHPRIASESLDSDRPRIEKILRVVRDCRYAIHDLSRIQASRVDEYYRLNMPFELGLDVGCKNYGSNAQRRKRCLILGERPYAFQQALSDLSGSDIEVHNNRVEDIIRCVRNWFSGMGTHPCAAAGLIMTEYLEFMGANYKRLHQEGFSDRDIETLPVPELLKHMRQWCKQGGFV